MKPTTTSPRVKRPEPERTQPNRAWSGVFGASRHAGNGVGRGANGNGGAGTSGPAPSGGLPGQDAIRRGVDLGYKVIDEYLKQGQAFASTVAAPSLPGGFAGQDLSQMTEQMFKYASDFASMWMQAMGMILANGPSGARPPGAPSTATVPAAGTAASAPAPARAAVELNTRRQARAALEIGSLSPPGTVAVPALRAEDGARLEGVTVAPGDGGPVVRIRISGGQAAGVYTGPVVDAATNLPVGKLTVWIDPRKQA
jgi:hypothetical protein